MSEHQHQHHDEENPHAGQGSVLLDVGGDVGALVVEMPVAMLGVEIEIRPVGAGDHVDREGKQAHHPHVAVVARPTPAGSVPSLVFGDLAQDTYELYEKGGGPVVLTAVVTGGEVEQLVWPA